MNKRLKKLDWEKRFDRLFSQFDPVIDWKTNQPLIKSFIRQTLTNEKLEIGNKFWEWFYDEKKYRYESVEEAIERITGVKDPETKGVIK